ncbi:MAG: aspartate ammonia-lyase [Blastocatellia bacterium AA13]|nr:MAG: aspartate ammonia-lyase [Blastocatellia bacterium AA13]
MSPSSHSRIESDSLGKREVPSDVYWGIQTLRAIENFPISGWKPFPELVIATVQIKKAAARTNRFLGVLDQRFAAAIETAADEVLSGSLLDQFVVDPFQAGAGTSHHMNTNEVLANRAIEILGGSKGDYSIVHPNDHVNYGQSTNDVFPTAMRLAAFNLVSRLIPEINQLSHSLAEKTVEFDDVIKSGRTHLQDAVPIRLGQEFGAYGAAVEHGSTRMASAAFELLEVGLGGSAVGTGLNTSPEYRSKVVEELRSITGYDLRAAGDYFAAMQSLAPFVNLSGALRVLAIDLIRIANDLRLLSSGPNTGLAEINLPPVQPGSSIMPGKVNPVMAEMLNMVCFQVIGNDTAIALAAQAGQLELNVMMPVVALNLLTSLRILTNAIAVFRTRCVEGITANRERAEWYAEHSLALVTALSPKIGYAKAAELAKESIKSGKTIRDLLVGDDSFSPAEIDALLDIRSMTE